MNEVNDGLLVAYADGKLDAATARILEARLAADAELRERLEHIRSGGLALAPAFEGLLSSAPVDAMRETLADLLAVHPVSAKGDAARTFWKASARVAAAIALVAAGIALGRFAPIWRDTDIEHEDWRDAVTEYAGLYTTDSFSGPPLDAGVETAGLARLGDKLGLDLSPDRIAIPDLQFRGAQILNYEGTPLGQIAYLDKAGFPVLFCIFAKSQSDAPFQIGSRDDFAFVTWDSGGHGFIVIARVTQARIAKIADGLRARF